MVVADKDIWKIQWILKLFTVLCNIYKHTAHLQTYGTFVTCTKNLKHVNIKWQWSTNLKKT